MIAKFCSRYIFKYLSVWASYFENKKHAVIFLEISDNNPNNICQVMFKVNKSLNLHMLQVIFWKYAKMQSLVLDILRLFFKKQKGKFITMVKYLINY